MNLLKEKNTRAYRSLNSEAQRCGLVATATFFVLQAKFRKVMKVIKKSIISLLYLQGAGKSRINDFAIGGKDNGTFRGKRRKRPSSPAELKNCFQFLEQVSGRQHAEKDTQET